MDKPKLGTGSVPVRVAAMAYGKEASWIRAGIIAGWLPIGEATRNGVKITSIEQMNSKYGRIHHLNPITKEDVIRHSDKLLDPENAICVSAATHKAIHYGTVKKPQLLDGERKPGDTCPWRK